MATHLVENLDQSGEGSLAWAIEQANLDTDLEVEISVVDANQVLTLSEVLPPILRNITFIGNGLTIQGQTPYFNYLYVNDGALNLTGVVFRSIHVTVADGDGEGGALAGDILLDDAAIQFHRSEQVVFDGSISLVDPIDGYGIVLVSGDGPLVLTGQIDGARVDVANRAQLHVGDGIIDGRLANVNLSAAGSTTVVFNLLHNAVANGTLDFDGMVRKTGEGDLRLTGQVGLRGNVEVERGALVLSDAASLNLSASIAILPEGRVELSVEQSAHIPRALSGTGLLVKEGDGVLTLLGDNTHTGTIEVLGGTLKVGNSSQGWLQSNVDLNDQTELHFDRNGDHTFEGSIQGVDVTVRKSGDGVITLAGDKDFSGALIIDSGTLEYRGGQSVDYWLDIQNSGAFLYARDGESQITGWITGGQMIVDIAGVVSLNTITDLGGELWVREGVVRLNNAQALGADDVVRLEANGGLALGADASIAGVYGLGDIDLNGQTLTLTGGADRTLAGSITAEGGQIIKRGTGVLTLDPGAVVDGMIRVEAGALVVRSDNGGDIQVSNALLSGDGRLGVVAVGSGGRFSAGVDDGVGQISTGDLSFQGAGRLLYDIDEVAHDQINVTGSVDLRGAILDVGFSPDITIRPGAFRIIDNDGSDAVIGQFNGLDEGAEYTVNGRRFTITYQGGDGNDVELLLAAPEPNPDPDPEPNPEPQPDPDPNPEPQPTPQLTPQQVRDGFKGAVGVDPTSPKAQSPTVVMADGTTADNPAYVAAQALTNLMARFEAGQISRGQLVDGVVELARPTSAVAVQAYQFFTGAAPQAQGVAWLVDSPDNLNDLTDAYYARFNEANRYINFAVNLGVEGEGRQAFSEAFDALEFEAAVRKAYDMIIGADQAAAAGIDMEAGVDWLVSQELYFDQVGGSDLAGKAAMVGYMMYAGFQAEAGRYYDAATEFLGAAFFGDAVYGVDLVGGQHLEGLAA